MFPFFIEMYSFVEGEQEHRDQRKCVDKEVEVMCFEKGDRGGFRHFHFEYSLVDRGDIEMYTHQGNNHDS